MSLRTGRNYRYAAGGHAATAALMGLAGAYVSKNALFIAAALLCFPALVALSFIKSDEIQYSRARNADSDGQSHKFAPVWELAQNKSLMLFAAVLVLFQFADASVLPLVGESLASTKQQHASLWMSGLIIVPQIVVAVIAPWVGYHSEKRGRRPLLLIGLAAEPIRAALLAFTGAYAFLVVAQLLDGVTAAIMGVLTIVVITDLTTGTGRFNLVHGIIGAAVGISASLSTVATGFLFENFGRLTGFLAIAGFAVAALALLWMFLLETKPERYTD
jgi:MFS family permease